MLLALRQQHWSILAVVICSVISMLVNFHFHITATLPTDSLSSQMAHQALLDAPLTANTGENGTASAATVMMLHESVGERVMLATVLHHDNNYTSNTTTTTPYDEKHENLEQQLDKGQPEDIDEERLKEIDEKQVEVMYRKQPQHTDIDQQADLVEEQMKELDIDQLDKTEERQSEELDEQAAALFVNTSQTVVDSKAESDPTLITIPSGNDTITIKCPQMHSNKPPLTSLIGHGHKIIGDVSWLLNFAIIGFGKCGTTTLARWIATHEKVRAFDRELYDLIARKPDLLVKRLYCNLEAGDEYIRGYKCPRDILSLYSFKTYRMHFRKAKLIIGIRHPVRWFESLYNFRIQNTDSPELARPAKELIGDCARVKVPRLTCTSMGNYAKPLSLLKKHALLNLTSEQAAIEHSAQTRYNTSIGRKLTNPVENDIFVVESSQLADNNASRLGVFTADLERFLGLSTPLPPMNHEKPGKVYNKTQQARRDKYKINICDEENDRVRQDLMEISKMNSIWIRQVFLQSPGVYTGNKDHVMSILENDWMIDPCAAESGA